MIIIMMITIIIIKTITNKDIEKLRVPDPS